MSRVANVMMPDRCCVCGKKLGDDRVVSKGKAGSAAWICEAERLCPKCAYIGETMDVKSVIRKEWVRLRKKQDAEEEELRNGPALQRSEKRAIVMQIVAYRQEHGLGSYQALAQKAMVSMDKIRGMLDGGVYSDEDWRRVRTALNNIKAKEEEEKEAQQDISEPDTAPEPKAKLKDPAHVLGALVR